MLKPLAPHSCNPCSNQLPSISRQTAMLRKTFSRIRLDILAPTVVTSTWRLAMRSSIVMGGTAEIGSFRCSHGEKSIGVRSGDRRGHGIGPQRPLHLRGYVAFSHCRSSFPQCTRVFVCRKVPRKSKNKQTPWPLVRKRTIPYPLRSLISVL
jgi:hypothetical protein